MNREVFRQFQQKYFFLPYEAREFQVIPHCSHISTAQSAGRGCVPALTGRGKCDSWGCWGGFFVKGRWSVRTDTEPLLTETLSMCSIGISEVGHEPSNTDNSR